MPAFAPRASALSSPAGTCAADPSESLRTAPLTATVLLLAPGSLTALVPWPARRSIVSMNSSHRNSRADSAIATAATGTGQRPIAAAIALAQSASTSTAATNSRPVAFGAPRTSRRIASAKKASAAAA